MIIQLISGSSGGGSVEDNIIRIPLGEVIDATPRYLQDGAGNVSRYAVTSTDCIIIGYLANPNGIGGMNISIGDYAGNSRTAGTYAIEIGYKASEKNEQGEGSVIIGALAHRTHTAVDGAISIGQQANEFASSNVNVAIGTKAGWYDGGAGNVFIGQYSSSSSATGAGGALCTFVGDNSGGGAVYQYASTFVGQSAGAQIGSGSGSNYNTFYGYKAGYGITGGSSNNTIIGARIEGAGVTSGFLGIGVGDAAMRIKSTEDGLIEIPHTGAGSNNLRLYFATEQGLDCTNFSIGELFGNYTLIKSNNYETLITRSNGTAYIQLLDPANGKSFFVTNGNLVLKTTGGSTGTEIHSNSVQQWLINEGESILYNARLTSYGSSAAQGGTTRTLYGETNDAATAEQLTSDGGAPSAANQIPVPLNGAVTVIANISCKKSGAQESAYLILSATFTNNGGTTARQGNVATLSLGGAGGYDGVIFADLIADNANDCVQIEVNGKAATNLKWTAHVTYSQVIYA